jgi:hypothetical protein
VSTAKSLFIRRESDVWDSLRSQWVALTEANECLAQRSAEVADLRLLCDELKSEAAAARVEVASARMKASSAREQVASLAEEMQRRQLELGQVTSERDQSRSQAAEAVSRAEALGGQLVDAMEWLAEASSRAGTLAEGLAVAVGSAQSAQAVASQQRARAVGMFCLLCGFIFVFIRLLVSEEHCPTICRVRRLLTSLSRTARRLPRRLSRWRPSACPCPRLSRPSAGPLASMTSPRVAPPRVTCGPWAAMCAADSTGRCTTTLGGPSSSSLPTMTWIWSESARGTAYPMKRRPP